MPRKMYLIAVRWVGTEITEENIKKIDALLTPVGEWIRFSGTCWVIKTDSTSQKIFEALASFLKTADNELIARIDPSDLNGWAPKWVDEWLAAKDPT